MKKVGLILLLAVSAMISNAQIFKIGDYKGQTLNVCKGQFVSSKFTTTQDGINGVPGYGDNDDYTVTFCSGDPTRQIRANFYYLNIETGFDYLRIYDGASTSAPLLALLTGDGVKHDGLFPGVFTSSGQCLTFRFTSDGPKSLGIWGGWDAFIGCTPIACGANQPASDECATATPICNLGGYCGSTSGWYTRGVEADSVEDKAVPPTYKRPFCGVVHNNSWLSFTASTTSASFDITSSNCSDPSLGIQAVILESKDCKSFSKVSTSCLNNAKGNFTLSATGLKVGSKYYIMVDGSFGNDCDYTILAKSGVQTINLTASNDNTLCSGQPLVLTANATGIGPFTYKWNPKPMSATPDSSSVTYPVATGTTYSCSVTGVCGTPTEVTYLPSVNITPKLTATDSVHICTGGTGAVLTSSMSVIGSPNIDYTNNANISIPDNNTTGITSTIAVGSIPGTVGNELEKVCFSISHGNVSELDVALKAPDGTVIDLTSGNGGNGINYTNTCFVVSGAPSIKSGTAPFTGNYLPEQPFSNVSASNITGNWGLVVKDTKADGNGLLRGWSLSFKNQFTYTWSPATGLNTTTGTTVTANPSVTTTYTASVTDKAGCTDSKPVFVRVTNTPLAPVVSSPVIYCINATATPLTATGSGLLWYTSATGGVGSTTAPTPLTTTAGIVDFYVSQKTSICEGERSKITVVVNDKLDGSFKYASNSYCQNTANPSPILGNGAVNGTFIATPTGLIFVNNKTGVIDLTASKPGTYTIVNEIDPIGGCATVTSDPFTITIHEDPTLINTPSTAEICSGIALNIPLSSSVPCKFDWIAADNAATTGESYATAVSTALINDVITNATNNSQVVKYTITLTSIAGACLNTKPMTIDVTVNPAPELNGTPTALDICSGVPLNVKLISTVPADFTWVALDNSNTTGETIGTPKTTDVINDVITNKTSTPQLVKYTVTLVSTAHACANIKPQTVDVTVNPAPELINTPSAVTVCNGNTLDIKLSSNIPADFTWVATDNSNTTGESHTTPKQSAVINDVIKNNTAGVEVVKYTITITSKQGSCLNTKPYTIDVTVNKVTAEFTAKPTTGEVPLYVEFMNSSSGKNYKNLWVLETGITSTDVSPSHTYEDIGQYSACLTVTDNDNCSDKMCTNIVVYITSSYEIPNVFTPNGDGINDVFTIKGRGIESLHGEIYNRWGQKEYEWDTTNGGWDGHSASGAACKEGTYYFILKIKGMDAKDFTEKGSLTLIK
jgi:gliding motility-associated-like protein